MVPKRGVVPEVYCTLLKSSTDKCAALSQHKSKKGLKMLERGPTPSSTPPSADGRKWSS